MLFRAVEIYFMNLKEPSLNVILNNQLLFLITVLTIEPTWVYINCSLHPEKL